jgi:hypothetical protein
MIYISKGSTPLIINSITFILFMISSLQATCANGLTPSELYGEAISGQVATKSIVISESTRYINVTDGDILELVHNGQRVVWRFDGVLGDFNLQEILPADFVDHRVMVYVSHISAYRAHQ